MHFAVISVSTIQFTWLETPMSAEISDKFPIVLALATVVLAAHRFGLSHSIAKSSGLVTTIRRCSWVMLQIVYVSLGQFASLNVNCQNNGGTHCNYWLFNGYLFYWCLGKNSNWKKNEKDKKCPLTTWSNPPYHLVLDCVVFYSHMQGYGYSNRSVIYPTGKVLSQNALLKLISVINQMKCIYNYFATYDHLIL